MSTKKSTRTEVTDERYVVLPVSQCIVIMVA